MFEYIEGKLAYKRGDYVIIDVNGIGYKIFSSISTIERIEKGEEKVRLYTYLYVREDNMSLYGFLSPEELNMFLLLISVSGVGPKAAISLTGSISPSKFSLAAITGDVKLLTKAQGIGNKMAQRIILELKDKIKKEQLAIKDNVEESTLYNESTSCNEAVNALMVLGYSISEASKAVLEIYKEGMDIETAITTALKTLAK